MDDFHARFIDLEERYTHQVLLLDELNQELTAACTRIDDLAREVRALREMLGTLAPPMEESPDE